MTTQQKVALTPPPLPPSNKTLRVVTKPMKLHEHIRVALMNGLYEKVLPYIKAVDNAGSVEGSLVVDKAMAGLEIRQHGKKEGITDLADAKVAELGRSLDVALRGMRDDSGNKIDQNSRRRLALQASVTPEALEATEAPNTLVENG